MNRKTISEALGGIDEGYIIEALSGRADLPRKEIETMNKKVRSFRPARVALIAACVCLALAATVTAAGYILYDNPAEMLEAFYGEDEYSSHEAYTVTESGIWQGDSIDGRYTKGEPFLRQWDKPAWNAIPISEEMKEELSQYIYAVGETMIYGDYSLTVEACMYSANTESGILYYTLENPNGVDNYEVGSKGQISWQDTDKAHVSGCFGFHYIDSANTTDTKLSACVFFVCAEPNYESDVPEEWLEKRPTLRITAGEDNILPNSLNYTITVDTYDLGLPALSVANGSIQLSPIGLRIYKEELGLDVARSVDELKLIFADGSEYVIRDDGVDEAYYALSSGGHVENSYINYVFNRVVDLDEVVSVVVNGTEYPVE